MPILRASSSRLTPAASLAWVISVPAARCECRSCMPRDVSRIVYVTIAADRRTLKLAKHHYRGSSEATSLQHTALDVSRPPLKHATPITFFAGADHQARHHDLRAGADHQTVSL